MMRMVMMTLAMTTAATIVACGAETEEPEGADETAQELAIGPGATFKKKSDLEADGWTCKLLEGTTMTFCTKPGTSGSYTCDANGNCISNKTTTTKPPIVSPAPTVVLGARSP